MNGNQLVDGLFFVMDDEGKGDSTESNVDYARSVRLVNLLEYYPIS
ncbi:hypothetical protein GK047_04030 [Paenibacillus sp. SYP-B3998]|uniref:Uncharacterized protein n=1 Tax=Paenibacillus sp. SYP-B3998 TaxID=2678564 RepID=A0A6G3ZUC1_9BACL|nr:hypothetical protein [Paenibacillus sp. SYP-B3998]NEW05189.1 hypothetical protein [Paenibacillus sp. SYP-B3998]